MTAATRIAVATLLAVALAGGAWWALRGADGVAAANADAGDDDVLYWYDPMRPDVHFDQPGRSPFMDMDLVPKRRPNADSGDGVTISPRTIQNLGFRTAEAGILELVPSVTVTGVVAIDERRIAIVTARADGWLESLAVRAEGEAVLKGAALAGLYSPALLVAQEEYLLALRAADHELVPAARQRLASFGVTDRQLTRIAARGVAERTIDLVAPASGVVTRLAARAGSAVTSGVVLMELADLAQVWVLVEVPESQGGGLRPDLPVTVELPGTAATAFAGRLDYVYPVATAVTRTLRARIVVANAGRTLRPGMSARVTIAGEPLRQLAVPTTALLRSGERVAVIVAEGEGRFRPVLVVPGVEAGEHTGIVSGLEEGDRVVVSGQFLIDSEANLRGVLDRLHPGEAR
jgi:membrane fusion protein, copper/silver efflux system